MNGRLELIDFLEVNKENLEEWEIKALELLSEGESNRSIATIVLGDTYYEYKIRALISKHDLKDAVDEARQKYNTESVDDILVLSNKKVNYLYFDIETSPCISYHFNHYDVTVRQEHKIKESHLLSVSWAFNDGEVQGFKLTPEEVANGDDLTLVVNLIEAIEKADILVGYNSKKFDIKYLNTRAFFYGLPPITTTKHIDLYEQVKKSFKFPSNSMGNVSKYAGLEGKLETEGWSLWRKCMEHWNKETCEQALTDMLTYNKQDIEATRDLHKRMQGWLKQSPNIGAIANVKAETSTLRCVKCGSDDVLPLNKLTFTNVKGWEMYRCNVCSGVSRIGGKGLVGCPVS